MAVTRALQRGRRWLAMPSIVSQRVGQMSVLSKGRLFGLTTFDSQFYSAAHRCVAA